MKKPLVTIDEACEGLEEKQYETVCVLIVKDRVSEADIVQNMMPALCNVGLFLPDDSYNIARTGNTIVIGKSCGYMDLGIDGKVH